MNLHVDCELITYMLLLFFREESILLRADETPADRRFVNRSFFRGMDVTILAQKTLLYCAHATRHPWCPAVPTRQDQDSRRDSIQPPPTLQASGTPASGGSTYGHSEAAMRELQPWGPRGEDQPWVDTPVRDARHRQLLTIIAAGPPPPRPPSENETQTQRTK
jgi:hypothetical protein